MGMKRAVSSVQPGGPIQFWIRRYSPGSLAGTAHPGHQQAVAAEQDALGERQRGQLLDGGGQRPSVVQHLPDVIQAVPAEAGLVRLELEDFGSRGLRALNAAGKHRLLRGQGREEHLGIRNRLEQPVVAGQRRTGGTKQGNQRHPLDAGGRKFVVMITDDHGIFGRNTGTDAFIGSFVLLPVFVRHATA